MDTSDQARETTLAILDQVFDGAPGPALEEDFAVRLWDGTVWPEEAVESPAFTLVLNHPGALRQMFLPPSELNLGESYIYGDFDVEGDLIAAFPLATTFEEMDLGLGDKLGLAWKLRSLPNTSAPPEGRQAATVNGNRHSRHRDRQAISYHYDVSNDFYALWLDRRMVCSCGYFADHVEDIHTAQERKLDYICRKLRLEPGERLLDVGRPGHPRGGALRCSSPGNNAQPASGRARAQTHRGGGPGRPLPSRVPGLSGGHTLGGTRTRAFRQTGQRGYV
jgi:cyclopropane-fatty-acyl-phospholipid synthase